MPANAPTMFGYAAVDARLAHTDPATADQQVQAWRHAFAREAARRGHTLAAVFIDVAGNAAAFYPMLERIRTDAITAVIVPDLTHLAHLPCLTGADVRAASRYLRARVLSLPEALAPGQPTVTAHTEHHTAHHGRHHGREVLR